MKRNGFLTTLRLLLFLCFAFSTAITYGQSRTLVEPANPCYSDTVNFSLLQVDTSWTFEWYFGNNVISTEHSPSIVFGASGWYFVSVWAYDSLNPNGGWASDSFALWVDSICPTNVISGQVYDDANNTGMFDAGDSYLSNQVVKVVPGNYHVLTNSNGDYTLKVHPGTYDVSIDLPLYWAQTEPVSPTSYSINFPGNGGLSTGNDFGLYAATNIQDLQVDINSFVVRPGFNTYAYVSYKNIGTQSTTAILNFTFDSQLSWVSSSPTEDNLSGTTATYNLGSLAPGDRGTIVVTLDGPTSLAINDPITYSAVIDPVATDHTPSDNVDTLDQMVRASYDPNDKRASSESMDSNGDIIRGEEISYVIRFQNTGTFLAENVRLEDTLDANLDLTTIEFTSASHTFDYVVDPASRAIVWYFNAIMLPDSNANEAESHGFAKFKIGLLNATSIPDGIAIENTAFIYFDFNEAVVTNTTSNKIVTPSASTGIRSLDMPLGVSTYPNPVADQLHIQLDPSSIGEYKVTIMNEVGQIVFQESGNDKSNVQIDSGDWATGLYIYRIEQNDKIAGGKIILE